MNTLLTRTLSGIVYISLIILSLWYEPLGFAVFGVFMLMTMKEFLLMQGRKQRGLLNYLLYILPVAAYIYISVSNPNGELLGFLSGLNFGAALVLIASLFIKTIKVRKEYAPAIAIVYIAIPFLLVAMWLKGYDMYNVSSLLILFIIIWVNDTFAYLVGVSFGKHKLWPEISPKKSWEGLIGGALMSVISGLIVIRFNWVQGFSTLEFVLFILIVIIAANLGDLLESKFKRDAGVKDSGNIIPGHGGLLDRLDSFILAIPLASFLFTLIA